MLDDVVVVIPGVEIRDEQKGLEAYWCGYASLPMMDDGKIRWYSEGKSKFLRKTFRKLEEENIGLDFKRTRKEHKAEIVIDKTREDLLGKPSVRGLARWSPDDPVWRLTTKKGIEHRKSTVVHEIGHALGLTHPENHARETDTIMSYNRDLSLRYFTDKDIDCLTGIYL